MVTSKVPAAALDLGRQAYRRLPESARVRLNPVLGRNLGPKVSLRRLDISDPHGRVRPFAIESPEELYIPQSIVHRGIGGYEPYALEAFMAVLDHAAPGPVLDIGSNVGLYGLLAATQKRRAVLFEPTPRIAASARRSASVSGLRLRVVEAALSDSSGTARLYLSTKSDASNSLNPNFRPSTEQLDVPAFTLDEYCAKKRIAPSVMKVDTETTEPAVIRGGRGVIARHRPWIFVEVLHGRGVGQLDAAMDGLGYTAYHLDGPGPRPVSPTISGQGDCYMFLLAPEPVPDALWESMNAWRSVLDRMRLTERTVEVSQGVLEPALHTPVAE